MNKGTPQPLLLASRLTLRQLHIFSTVTEMGSILRAAEWLNMTQPAVSRAVMEIERIVGTQLMERTPRGTGLTEAGELFVGHARAALAEMRSAWTELNDRTAGRSGQLTIGALPNGEAGPFGDALLRARLERPGLRLAVVEGLYGQIIPSLRAGELDFAIGRLRQRDSEPGLITETLYHQSWGVVARAGHPALRRERLDLAELGGAAWILPARTTPIRDLVKDFFRRSDVGLPQDSLEMSALSISRGLLLNADMLMFVPLGTFRPDIEAGRLAFLPLALDYADDPVGLFRREHGVPSIAETYFVDLLRDACRTLGFC
ncbi:LysR substrate-binding domain-containing protein [uncultured Roseibium sp.]|uniref:LysR substrate-binding domain-containing protein n=1 Tax=uncultured Roseibium sp. TaxID=1936171 RepID=UPI003216D741